MKRFILFILSVVPVFAGAQEFALKFDRVPLNNFAQATYKVMLKRDYVLSSTLLAIEKPISVSVHGVKLEALAKIVDRVLSEHGVTSVQRDGVYYLSGSSLDSNAAQHSTFPLTGSVSGAAAGIWARPGVTSPAGAVQESYRNESIQTVSIPRIDTIRNVYMPMNRKSDFIVSALNAAFTTKGAAVSAGGMVVITGADEKEIQSMLRLASQVDILPHKVKVSATFVEVSTNTTSNLGVSVVANLLGAQFGVKVGETSTGSLSIRGKSFEAVLDALAADGRFKQVSNPSGVLDDYEKITMNFGDRVPTIGSSSVDKNGNTVQQIVYQQSGVVLDVQPRVMGSGRINVTVDGQVSSFSATTTGVSGSPTQSNRQVQATVTLEDGELLVIGGLSSDKKSSSRSGFSFLPASWSVKSELSGSTDLLLIWSATLVK